MFARRSWPTIARRSAAKSGQRCGGAALLLVTRHRGEPVHVQQQNAAALQIENVFLAPELQLTVDAFARGADEDAELLLRDVHFGSVIGGQRAEPSRQTHRQRLQHRFLHPLALPANQLTQQLDDFDRDARLALEVAEKILAPPHEQFRRLGAGFDPDLAAANPEQRVAAVALLEQHLAQPKLLGVAKAGYSR